MAISIVMLLIGGGSMAVAAVVDDPAITTCFGKGKATWRPIDATAGETCKSGEKQLQLYSKSGADARFLSAAAKAVDSDKLDGLDSTAFLPAAGKAVDSDKLDGLDSTAFLPAAGKAVDSDKLDGLDSTAFDQSAAITGRNASACHFGVCMATTWDSGSGLCSTHLVNSNSGDYMLWLTVLDNGGQGGSNFAGPYPSGFSNQFLQGTGLVAHITIALQQLDDPSSLLTIDLWTAAPNPGGPNTCANAIRWWRG